MLNVYHVVRDIPTVFICPWILTAPQRLLDGFGKEETHFTSRILSARVPLRPRPTGRGRFFVARAHRFAFPPGSRKGVPPVADAAYPLWVRRMATALGPEMDDKVVTGSRCVETPTVPPTALSF